MESFWRGMEVASMAWVAWIVVGVEVVMVRAGWVGVRSEMGFSVMEVARVRVKHWKLGWVVSQVRSAVRYWVGWTASWFGETRPWRGGWLVQPGMARLSWCW